MNLEKLSEQQFEFLSVLHKDIIIDGEFIESRLRTFEKKVGQYKKDGYDTKEFERYLRIYKNFKKTERRSKENGRKSR